MKRNRYKMIIASVGICAFLAMGNLYAQSNDGLQLQEWYKIRSNQLTTQVIDSTAVQGLTKASQSMNDSLSGLAIHADANLSKALDDSSKDVITNVQSASEVYMDQMLETANELIEITKDQLFGQYIRTTTSENNDELEQLVEATIKELTQQLETQ